MYIKIGKRTIDLIGSLACLVILIPLMLLIALAIKIESKGPILFKQKRVGCYNTYFNIYKFRTMKVDTPKDRPTHLLPNPSSYITRVGTFLRKTSLDELPQLWNILLGQMSFVGPRPALWNQEDLLYLREKNESNKLKPGLTGWAQINGRDSLTIEEKAYFDGEYVVKMSLLFDVKCIFCTFKGVMLHEGVKEGGVQS